MKNDEIPQNGQAAVLHYENQWIPLRIKDVHNSPDSIPCIPHWHDDFELVYIDYGSYEYRINDDSLCL